MPGLMIRDLPWLHLRMCIFDGNTCRRSEGVVQRWNDIVGRVAMEIGVGKSRHADTSCNNLPFDSIPTIVLTVSIARVGLG
jgi:hypothetical protein